MALCVNAISKYLGVFAASDSVVNPLPQHQRSLVASEAVIRTA